MSRVRSFMPQNPLAKILGDPNGLLPVHAVQRAGANVAQARGRYREALDHKLAELRARLPEASGAEGAFYRLAREIIADAGALEHAPLSRAAASLCDLLDADLPPERKRRATAVHVDAIAALSTAEASDRRCEAILQGLAALWRS